MPKNKQKLGRTHMRTSAATILLEICAVGVSEWRRSEVKLTQVRSKVLLVSKQRRPNINHEIVGVLATEKVRVTRNICVIGVRGIFRTEQTFVVLVLGLGIVHC